MYKVYFKHNGEYYHCAEQAYTHQLAKLCNATKIAGKLMTAGDGYECLRYSKPLKDHPVWKANQLTVMRAVLLSKFTFSKECGAYLVGTEDKTLLECSFDKLYGTGRSLEDGELNGAADRPGQNMCGVILEEVREALNST